MRKPMILIISIVLLMPVAILLADSHEGVKKEKRLVVKADSDIDVGVLTELIEQAESNMNDEDVEVHVFVTAEGEMDTRQHDDSMSHRGHRKIHMARKGGDKHGDHHKRKHRSGGHHPMNEGTAKCILKNIDGINSNAAAQLLKQACGALNKTEE